MTTIIIIMINFCQQRMWSEYSTQHSPWLQFPSDHLFYNPPPFTKKCKDYFEYEYRIIEWTSWRATLKLFALGCSFWSGHRSELSTKLLTFSKQMLQKFGAKANMLQIFGKYLANLCEIFVRENIENSWEGHHCWKWHMVPPAPFTLCWQYFHFKIQLPMYHVFSLLSYLLVADIVKFANHVDNTMFTRHLTTAFYRHLAIHSWYINTENTLDGTVLKLVLA